MISLTFLLFIPLIASRSIDNGLEIYNGKDAVAGEFPHIVSLRLRMLNKHVCGGSLIGPYWVLTAAHCLQLDECPKAYEVLYGTLKSFHKEPAPPKNVTNVVRFIVHDKYRLGFNTHDIALVQLAKYVNLPNYMQLADIPRAYNQKVTVAGWGLDKNFEYAKILQKIDLTVYIDEICEYMAPKFYYPTTHMCVGSPIGRTCLGDSGGPVIYDNVQYGIVSFGIANCSEPIPSYLTNVASLRSWIRQHTRI